MRIHEKSSDSPPIVWLSLRRTVQFYVEYTYVLFVNSTLSTLSTLYTPGRQGTTNFIEPY